MENMGKEEAWGNLRILTGRLAGVYWNGYIFYKITLRTRKNGSPDVRQSRNRKEAGRKCKHKKTKNKSVYNSVSLSKDRWFHTRWWSKGQQPATEDQFKCYKEKKIWEADETQAIQEDIGSKDFNPLGEIQLFTVGLDFQVACAHSIFA